MKDNRWLLTYTVFYQDQKNQKKNIRRDYHKFIQAETAIEALKTALLILKKGARQTKINQEKIIYEALVFLDRSNIYLLKKSNAQEIMAANLSRLKDHFIEITDYK